MRRTPRRLKRRASCARRRENSLLAESPFEPGKGPVIAIDEAHRNTHHFGSASFRGLVQLLQADGYQVRPLAERISPASLAGVAVLLLSGPGGWFGPDQSLSDQEVADLIQWVKGGHSLLLILDHMPAPRNAARLTAALGISNWENGYVTVQMADSLVGNIIERVATFGGSAFLPPWNSVAGESPSSGRPASFQAARRPIIASLYSM